MKCKDYIQKDVAPVSIERPSQTIAIDQASRMTGIDLTKPIDLSQMPVRNVYSDLYTDPYSFEGEFKFKRCASLHAWVTNEFGEQEELSIQIELISKRMPKL